MIITETKLKGVFLIDLKPDAPRTKEPLGRYVGPLLLNIDTLSPEKIILIKADVYKWGMLMAGALVAAAPPLIVYAFLMDYYIAGLTAGATKG